MYFRYQRAALVPGGLNNITDLLDGRHPISGGEGELPRAALYTDSYKTDRLS